MPRFCIKIGHDYFLFPPLSPHLCIHSRLVLDGTTDQAAVAIGTERSGGFRCKGDEVTGGPRKLLKLQSYGDKNQEGDTGLTDKVASGKIFGTCPVRISVGTPNIIAEVSSGLSQSLQANALMAN